MSDVDAKQRASRWALTRGSPSFCIGGRRVQVPVTPKTALAVQRELSPFRGESPSHVERHGSAGKDRRSPFFSTQRIQP
jgi:hypothetical protein